MNAYEMGCKLDAESAPRATAIARDAMGSWSNFLPTGTEITDELRTVGSMIIQLDRDIKNTPKLDSRFVNDWDSFHQEWDEYFTVTLDWLKSSVGTTVAINGKTVLDKIGEYKERFGTFRKIAVAAGTHTYLPQPPGEERESKIPWAWIIGGAGAVALTVVGISAYRGFTVRAPKSHHAQGGVLKAIGVKGGGQEGGTNWTPVIMGGGLVAIILAFAVINGGKK